MVALVVTCITVLLATAGEVIAAWRMRTIAALAFGPRRRPALWTIVAPTLRVAAQAGMAWGLVTLMLILPKPLLRTGQIPEHEYRHLLIVLDVSPSMRLVDAGPTQAQSRMHRAADVMKSFFERTPMDKFKVSVVATYTGAIPVVVDTTDMEVIHNIFNDLPMNYAFKPGPTDIFAGLIEAAKIAKPWRSKTTTLMIISDGDTIPATGMPKMPDSIAATLVLGIGDTQAGRFIEGHHSRQDASTLRQLAARLRGVYHNGNEKQISTTVLREMTSTRGKSLLERLTIREYALLSIIVGATTLALLPVLLWYFGTTWRPGVPIRRAEENSVKTLSQPEPIGV